MEKQKLTKVQGRMYTRLKEKNKTIWHKKNGPIDTQTHIKL